MNAVNYEIGKETRTVRDYEHWWDKDKGSDLKKGKAWDKSKNGRRQGRLKDSDKNGYASNVLLNMERQET